MTPARFCYAQTRCAESSGHLQCRRFPTHPADRVQQTLPGSPGRRSLKQMHLIRAKLCHLRNVYVIFNGQNYLSIHSRGGRMEKLTLVSLAVSLSVIFYVVTYFLITWQWPQTILSIFMSTYFLIMFSKGSVKPLSYAVLS